jgi:hypothetical protein
MSEAMKTRRRSQDKSITSELIEDAVAEQLKSQAADEGLEKGKRGTIATPRQIVGSRRRADHIILELIHDWSDPKIQLQKTKSPPHAQYNLPLQNMAGVSSQYRTHRGRRSRLSQIKRAIKK